MNILIAGCGQVGKSLAKQLNEEGHEVTVMDTNYQVVESATAASDVIGFQGFGVFGAFTAVKKNKAGGE